MQSKKYPLLVFYAICFVVPWLAWSIMAFKGFNMLLFYAGSACSIAGLVAIYVEKGKEGIYSIFRSFRLKAPLSAWFLAVLLPFVWQALSFVLYGILFNPNGIGTVLPENISNLFTWHILWLFTTGPLEEELGWRGFLLPKFLGKYSFIKANIILGIIWAFWHLPIMYGKWITEPISVLYFFVGVICFAFIIGIIYLISKGNLLLCILSHWSINATQEMFGSMFPNINTSNQWLHVFSVVVLVIITVILLFLYRNKIKVLSSEFNNEVVQ